MKVKLNFQVDKPTLNKRIYSKKVLKKAFDEKFLSGDVFITDNYSNNGKINFSKIIGIAKKYKINSKLEIIIDVKLLKTDLTKLFEDKKFKITSSGYGGLENDGKTIKDDFKLLHFFIPEENK